MKKFTFSRMLLVAFLTFFAADAFCQHDQFSKEKLLEIALKHSKQAAIDRGGSICQLDSIVTFVYPSAGDSSVSSKILYTRNAKGSITGLQFFGKNPQAGLYLSSSVTIERNAQDQIIKEEYYGYGPSGNITFGGQVLYFPKSNTNNLDSTISSNYDGAVGGFVLTTKSEYTYDASNREVGSRISNWSNTQWFVNTLTTTEYTATGKLKAETIFTAPTFDPTTKTDFTYDSNDSLILRQRTDLADNRVEDKQEYEYNTADRVTKTTRYALDFSTQQLVLLSKQVEDFDNQNRLEFYEFSSFYFGNQADRAFYNYSNTTGCLHFINNYIAQDGQNFVFDDRDFYYHNTSISTDAANDHFQKAIAVAPNPTTDVLKIQAPDGTQIRVLDLAGRTLRSLESSNGQTEISVESLPAGLYFLHLSNGGRQVAQKFVKN